MLGEILIGTCYFSIIVVLPSYITIDSWGLSDIKLWQSTDNRRCLSHLPAGGGCVFICLRWSLSLSLSVCVCVCVKSLGISPSSHRPFKCMRQYHTILAEGKC